MVNIKLKELRVKNGNLTQKQAAELIGCSHCYYSAVERHEKDGNIDFWRSVQTVFNLSDADTWATMNSPITD